MLSPIYCRAPANDPRDEMGKALRYFGTSVRRLLKPLAPPFRPLKNAIGGLWEHNVSRMAASIAYFGAFSLAPMLVIIISLASLVFGKSASEGLVVDRLSEIFGEGTASFIQSMLAAIYQSEGITLATVLAVLLLLWSSTRIVGAVRGSLNDIWGVPGHGGTGFLGFVVGKLIDLGMVLVFGFMFLGSMLASAAISALTGYFSDRLPLPGWLLQLIGVAFSLFVITFFLTIIFRVLPNIKIRILYIFAGASVTAVLFALGNYVIGHYLGRTSPESAFGAAGSLAVILIWMYYSAHIILFGAEVTRAYAERGKARSMASRPRELDDAFGDSQEDDGGAAAGAEGSTDTAAVAAEDWADAEPANEPKDVQEAGPRGSDRTP